MSRLWPALLILLLPLWLTSPAMCADSGLQEQEAFRAAVAEVANMVVQIRTIGGLQRVEGTQLAQGPTTGVVVSSDGYIVSSTLGFAQQPSSILVRLPDGSQVPAKMVARDNSRMLVLLKVKASRLLQVPESVPTAEIQVGQWAVAVGRTFDAEQVGVSVGIVSAVRRKYGRAIQTDANVSTANYGGALVDLHGRVLGILVPMSPQSDSELASAQFYDSGIGFAVPLEHVLANLERWKKGDDLLRGKLGVGLKSGNVHALPPTVSTVWPGSPAAKAGWKPNDVIIAVEGREVASVAQLRYEIVPRYAEDRVRVTLRRGEERMDSLITLAGELNPFRHPFLGVLPMREAAKKQAGVQVRAVWPESPAAVAGLRRGDRIVKMEAKNIASVSEAVEAIGAKHPEQSLELTIMRDKRELTLSASLGVHPEKLLTVADLPDAVAKPSQEEEAPLDQQDLKSLRLPEFSQRANYFLPSTEKGVRSGLLVWLAQGNTDDDLLIAQQWQEMCERDGVILLIAHAEADTGWAAGDLQYLDRLARAARSRWSLDPRRLSVGGQGKAGQTAYALAFRRSSQFNGVVSIDGPLPRTLKIPEVGPIRLLSILVVETSGSPFGALLREDIQTLRGKGYPASWLEQSTAGAKQTALDPRTLNSIGRWLDMLDRF